MTTPSVMLLGRDDPLAAELAADGWAVLASNPSLRPLDALVVVLQPPTLNQSFLDITDADLDAALARFLDLFEALRDLAPQVREAGAILVISDRGHLGGWHGAHAMAFSGAVAGLLRSVALENAPRRVRANLLAVPLPGAKPPADPTAVARLAGFLISSEAASVNGELILADSGASLQLREARNRSVNRLPVTLERRKDP